jgi:CO/xanthine dehydrogenase Mo-binding subunit
VTIVEQPYSRGPWGAKGVGELPIDVAAPAVAAAVHRATGLLVTELPILPETMLAAADARSTVQQASGSRGNQAGGRRGFRR